MYKVGAAGIADRENRSLYIGIAILLAMIVMCVGAYLKKHYVKGNSIGKILQIIWKNGHQSGNH